MGSGVYNWLYHRCYNDYLGAAMTDKRRELVERQIPLTRGMTALVDDQDYAVLSDYEWHALKCGSKLYAASTTPNKQKLLMHRIILGATDGQVIDHLNGNGLDNRRGNIRIASISINNHNRTKKFSNKSGFRGVSKDIWYDGWRAYIRENKKTKYLGYFHNPEDAAKAYDISALRLFGEHAVTNFPRNNYD